MDNLPTAYIIIDADEINPAFRPWVDFGADLVANDGDPFGPADYVGHGSEMTMVLNWATGQGIVNDLNPFGYIRFGGHIQELTEAITLAVDWAGDRELRIGIPWGSGIGDPTLYHALANLPDNVKVFAAVGNHGLEYASYPAAYGHLDQVIAVGARGGYSNAGGEVIFGGVAMFGWPVIGTSVATMEAMGQWVN